mmetsp:Transcript_28128/g.89562  ORF Transcript_28128/g.89562 Transcript_28128/m.89562 type:complete len:227 (-) Transcript_28128:34-714(-)
MALSTSSTRSSLWSEPPDERSSRWPLLGIDIARTALFTPQAGEDGAAAAGNSDCIDNAERAAAPGVSALLDMWTPRELIWSLGVTKLMTDGDTHKETKRARAMVLPAGALSWAWAPDEDDRRAMARVLDPHFVVSAKAATGSAPPRGQQLSRWRGGLAEARTCVYLYICCACHPPPTPPTTTLQLQAASSRSRARSSSLERKSWSVAFAIGCGAEKRERRAGCGIY